MTTTAVSNATTRFSADPARRCTSAVAAPSTAERTVRLRSLPRHHTDALIAIARRGLSDDELVAAVRSEARHRNRDLATSSIGVYVSQTRLLASVRHYLDELIREAEICAMRAAPDDRAFWPHLLRLAGTKKKKLALSGGGSAVGLD